MKISKLIEKLTGALEEHGDVEVVDSNSYDIKYTEVQKYIKAKYAYNEKIIERHTQDLNENYQNDLLESERFVESGLCIKLY